jgi:hypothetical protein
MYVVLLVTLPAGISLIVNNMVRKNSIEAWYRLNMQATVGDHTAAPSILWKIPDVWNSSTTTTLMDLDISFVQSIISQSFAQVESFGIDFDTIPIKVKLEDVNPSQILSGIGDTITLVKPLAEYFILGQFNWLNGTFIEGFTLLWNASYPTISLPWPPTTDLLLPYVQVYLGMAESIDTANPYLVYYDIFSRDEPEFGDFMAKLLLQPVHGPFPWPSTDGYPWTVIATRADAFVTSIKPTFNFIPSSEPSMISCSRPPYQPSLYDMFPEGTSLRGLGLYFTSRMASISQLSNNTLAQLRYDTLATLDGSWNLTSKSLQFILHLGFGTGSGSYTSRAASQFASSAFIPLTSNDVTAGSDEGDVVNPALIIPESVQTILDSISLGVQGSLTIGLVVPTDTPSLAWITTHEARLAGTVSVGPINGSFGVGSLELSANATAYIMVGGEITQVSDDHMDHSFIDERSTLVSQLTASGGIFSYLTSMWSPIGTMRSEISFGASYSNFSISQYGYPVLRYGSDNIFIKAPTLTVDMILTPIAPELVLLLQDFNDLNRRISSIAVTPDFAEIPITELLAPFQGLTNFTTHTEQYFAMAQLISKYWPVPPSFDSAMLVLLQSEYGQEAFPDIDSINYDDDNNITSIALLFYHDATNHTYLSMFGLYPTFDTLCQRLFGADTFPSTDLFTKDPSIMGLINYLKYRAKGHCQAPLSMTGGINIAKREVFHTTCPQTLTPLRMPLLTLLLLICNGWC